MESNPAAIAEAYYKAMSQRNLLVLEGMLSKGVTFKSPFSTASGKENILKLTEEWIGTFETLTVRSVLSAPNQAAVVYEARISGMPEGIPTVSLLSIEQGLITQIELFYDASPFKAS